MKIWMLTAVIAVALSSNSSAAGLIDQNNSINPRELSSEAPIGPSLPPYAQITANNQPNHHLDQRGPIQFEDQTTDKTVKFNDDPNEHGYLNINRKDPDNDLANISFDEEKSRQYDSILNTDDIQYENDRKNSQDKLKYKGSKLPETELNTNINNDVPQNDSQSSFKNDAPIEDNSQNIDASEINQETTDTNTKISDFDKNAVTERITLDDNNRIPKQNNETTKKPALLTKANNPELVTAPAPNSRYPGLGYPGYLAVGYTSLGFPNLGNPNAGYPSYPSPIYSTLNYPYPSYLNLYPIMPYQTSGYLGYSPHPSPYLSMAPGYLGPPSPVYQGSTDARSPADSIGYPNSVQAGHPNMSYPSPGDAGISPASGKPGGSYPASEYPYYPGYLSYGYQSYPGDLNAQYPGQNPAQYRLGPLGYQTGHYKPYRTPKSLTQRAVSAVAEALASIAKYDDYQCVPRMLCEVASGSAASSTTLQKATAGLQPLMQLLQAQNGLSSSPLILFGHAAVLGVTAKGDLSACIQAYPLCPNDPKKLIEYLNNYNGGFFRFFGQPDSSKQPHNLEQFYKYLSGQYGYQQQQQNTDKYRYLSPYGYGIQALNPYGFYGTGYYGEHNSFSNLKDIDSEIEARIQNRPGANGLDDEYEETSEEEQGGSKWSFPEESNTKKRKEKHRERVIIKKQADRPPRGSKTLKFPDERSDDRQETDKTRDYVRKQKMLFFPGEIHQQSRPINNFYQTSSQVNTDDYVFDHKHKFYVRKPKADPNVEIVYVVRGNGDPNHPEVVRLRPGQRI